MWKNRHLGDAVATARLLPPPLLLSAHFLTARRIARYEDQMRADRVSSIVYTLKKPSIINLDHDLLPSAFDRLPPAPPLSVRHLFPLLSLFGSFFQKGTGRRETAFIPSRSSARIDRVPLFSIRRFDS